MHGVRAFLNYGIPKEGGWSSGRRCKYGSSLQALNEVQSAVLPEGFFLLEKKSDIGNYPFQ